jgi:uncharacterized protein
MDRFSDGVAKELGIYVYRLIDPRDGMTFYVGRGKGSRIFSHASDEQAPTEEEDSESLKLRTIREIKAAGLDVLHVIHRHRLTDDQAREVEAALIDAYPGLSNIQGGFESDRGVMHAEEATTLYEATEAVFQHHVMLVNVSKIMSERNLLDATRYAWKARMENAEQVQYVLPVAKGIIQGAFVADRWMYATPDNFPGFPLADPTRVGFEGEEAPAEIVSLYRGKRVAWGRYAFKYERPTPRGRGNRG